MVNNNWDYDKLFAVGNVVGVKNVLSGEYNTIVCAPDFVDWTGCYKNKSLSCGGVEIQYIIKLDNEGNVVEKLFNRKTDMKKIMPKLENGFFVEVEDVDDGMLTKGVVVNDVIVYQDGSCDLVDCFDKHGYCDTFDFRVARVWKNVPCFKDCYKDNYDWSADND